MNEFNSKPADSTKIPKAASTSVPMRIMFVGTGGQGVLTAARLLCDALMAMGHQVVSGQLHGMAQRGGSVQSSVLVDAGDCPMVPEGQLDYLIGFEPVETVRARTYLGVHSTVFMNTAQISPYVLGQRHVWKASESDKYPEIEELKRSLVSITPEVYTFNGSAIAESTGTLKALNMVMLGCLLGSDRFSDRLDDFWHYISESMPPRLREGSVKAFLEGTRQIQRWKLRESVL